MLKCRPLFVVNVIALMTVPPFSTAHTFCASLVGLVFFVRFMTVGKNILARPIEIQMKFSKIIELQCRKILHTLLCILKLFTKLLLLHYL